MADVRPFRAWRYNTDKVSLDQVIAPPYDVIDQTEQDRLYARNPHNIIRLILGKDDAAEGMREKDKYSRAAAYLAAWKSESVLAHDRHPAFYLYRQTYAHPETGRRVERTGLFALVKLEGFESRTILPHERTHTGPKVDRTHLIKAVEGNLSPVFGLYEDKHRDLVPVFKKAEAQSALFSFVDHAQTQHDMWCISKQSAVDAIHAFFSTQSIMIADGHHRYETALAYRDWARTHRAGQNGTASSDYVMMALINIHDEGLLVFPTHRLLTLEHPPGTEELREKLSPYFNIVSFSVRKPEDWNERLSALDPKQFAAGIQWPDGEGWLLEGKDPERIREAMPAGKPGAWYRLDVSVVSHVIIEHALGITGHAFETAVSYTRHLDDAVKQVSNGRAEIGIIMRAPDVATVKEVCYSGEVMPQKSTYFYPKLPSGLLLHLHERSV